MCKNKSKGTEDESFLPGMNQQGIQLSDLRSSLTSYLKNNGYAEVTIHRYNHELDLLQAMMNEKGIMYYTADAGEQFRQLRFREVNDYGLQTTIKRIIFRLNCLCEGEPIPKQVYSKVIVPTGYRDILSDFAQQCIGNGNAKITVRKKDYYAKRFFINLSQLGCKAIGDITQELVIKTSLMEQHKDGWQFISGLLRFLFESGYVNLDFSPLVPINRKGYSLPTTYTVDEISRVEKSAGNKEKKPFSAERDLAITMLASRYGFRSGDIRRLTLDDVDFDNDRISFIQHKSSEPVDYILYPEVKAVLSDYINNCRPESELNEIFLCAHVPYTRLSASGINSIVSRAFKRSGVDTTGKHHGPHALRSSNSSIKVNGGMTYAETKQSIGWKDPGVMKHYVRIDVENLRLCALKPIPVEKDSFFDRFLQGKERL